MISTKKISMACRIYMILCMTVIACTESVQANTFRLPASKLMPGDSIGFFTSFDKVKIHYEVKGSGEPVLLVHGFTGNGESWKKDTIYQDLVNKGFKVIILDLRGNGLSDKPHVPEAYANDAEAKDIMGLLDWLGISKYAVIGYSRGSIITARLLVKDKRISRAVMGGIGVDFTNPDWPRRINFYKALSGEPSKELEPMVKRIQEAGLDQLALAYQQKEQPSTSKPELAAVQQQVLVICGEQDADNGSASELAKLMPHSEQASVPGDHGGTVKTAAFSEKVISFLLRTK
jgi:pimeloyl-ACP methyl ester carboxylesterase